MIFIKALLFYFYRLCYKRERLTQCRYTYSPGAKDKISYSYIDIPDFSTTWDREIYSRNYALTLPIYEDDDIIISDKLEYTQIYFFQMKGSYF